MTRYLVAGAVPLNVGRIPDGGYLTPESFAGVQAGSAPACHSHWKADDYICRHSASWAVDGGELRVFHLLDDAQPIEAALVDEVRAGRLFWSYGQQGTPDATRQAVAQAVAQHGQRERVYWPSALKGQRVNHWSYVRLGAWPQSAIHIVGVDYGDGWQLAGDMSEYVRKLDW